MITIPDLSSSESETFLPNAFGKEKSGAVSPFDRPFTWDAFAIGLKKLNLIQR